MRNSQQELFHSYKARFLEMADEDIISSFNGQVGNNSWTGSRAAYLVALHEEFKQRGFDYSAVGGEEFLSFSQKVKLSEEKQIVPLEEECP